MFYELKLSSKKLDDKQKKIQLYFTSLSTHSCQMKNNSKNIFLWKLFTCVIAKCSRIVWKLLTYYRCKFISKWSIIAEKSKITHQSIAFPIVRYSCLRVASLDCRSSVKIRENFCENCNF